MDRASLRRLEEDPVLEQAADWFVELQAAEAPVERIEQWQLWLSSDEKHRVAYRNIELLWDAVETVRAQAWPKPEDVFEDRYDATMTVSAWRSENLKRRWFIPTALAAAVITSVGLGLWQVPAVKNFFAPSSLSIETRAGERREVRMSDGSTIAIGGSSSVSAEITPYGREIRLKSGEAFFEVAKDPVRPFVVHAGNAAFTALGTQFNVRNTADEVVIAVAEGVVQVDTASAHSNAPVVDSSKTEPAQPHLRLIAGEQLSVASAGTVSARQAVDTSAVGGWRAGKLHYLNEPLSSVIADVRRYAARDIDISDPAIGNLRITGTVFENDIESWLRTLETAFPLHAAIEPSGKIVLTPAPR